MIPVFVIASQDFDKDLVTLKEILNGYEKKTHTKNGYKFSKEAQMAAGWWFYNVYFQKDFMKKIIELEFLIDKKTKDEQAIMETIQKKFKQNGSKARIRLYHKKPFMTRYWSWLMR